MATAAEIQVKVGADVSGLTKGAQDASNAIKKIGNEAKTTEDKLNEIADKIGKSNPVIAQNFNKISDGIKDVGKSAASAVPELEEAGTALTEFGGVAAIAGTAGIAAVGIIIAGVVEDIRRYAAVAAFAHDQQVALNTAIGEAQAKTAGEVAELKSLVSIATDESLSRDARTEAMKKLNKEYPAYFTNATLDGQTSEKLAAITDKLTQSILLNAKAKAIQSQIDKSAERVSAAQNDENADLLSNYDKLKIGVTALFGGQTQANLKAVKLATKDYNDLVSRETKLQDDLAKQLNDTNKVLANQGSLFDDVDKKVKAKKDKLEKDKILVPVELRLPENEADLIARGLKTIDLAALFKKGLRDTPTIELNFDTKKAAEQLLAFGDFQKEFQKIKDAADISGDAFGVFAKKFEALNGIKSESDWTDDLVKKFQKVADSGIKLAKTIAGTVANTIGDAVAQIGVVIGDGLSGKGINDAIQGFLTILGDGLIQIGKATIAYAVQVAVIQKLVNALLKLGPIGAVAAIAAGVAAIALGTVLKNKVSKTKGFADGGIASGPTSGYQTTLHGNELIVPLDKPSKIAQALGAGGGAQVVVLETRVRGNDLYFLQQNVTKSKKRMG